LRFISLLLIFFFASDLHLAQTSIKSLHWGSGSLLNFPVVFPDSSDKLIIDFDIQSEFYPELSIVFKFCDRNWNPYSSVFLQAQGKDIATELSYTRLPSTVTGADYHYRGKFPNNEIEFPFSGRWMFFITSLYDTSDVYSWGEFFVVYESIPVNVEVNKLRREGAISKNTVLDRTYEMRVNTRLNEKQNEIWLRGIEVIENRKLNYPVEINRTDFSETKYFEMEDVDEFTFIWKDILPGNEYRQIDFRNENKYPKENTPINYHHIETERFYNFGKRDMNGSFILKNFNNSYSDYMDVLFQLRVPDYYNKDIYLVGSFNYWELSPWYKLEGKDGLYKIKLELKRGKYDYQYVTVPKGGGFEEADWYELEGNFWETSNEYHIFVNYNSQELGGYDKIIGYYKYILNGDGKD